MKTMKQILAGFLVMAMLVAGLMITPMDAKAADAKEVPMENGVKFVLDAEKYNFAELWEDKTAPTKDGYVFGGWHTTADEASFTALTEDAAAVAVEENTEVWAKFVPAEVLSIRAQLQKATEDGSENRKEGDRTYLRLLSGVNELNYQNVGFDIYYNKGIHEENPIATNITKVFSKITNDETGEGGLEPDAFFGEAATHFSVLRLDGIYEANYTKVIYVTPQWTTQDGTLVRGQAKYVRVMDGYAENRFISVPVNFLAGNAVAAGQLEMHYDSDKLEVVETVGFDAGTLMTEMEHKDDANGTIKIVGNIAEAPDANTTGVEAASKIYANVWFKVKSGETIDSGTKLQFEVNNCSFCNWEEKMVDVTPWNVTYLK